MIPRIIAGGLTVLELVALSAPLAAHSTPHNLPPITSHNWNEGMSFIQNPSPNEKPPPDCIWSVPGKLPPLATVRGVLYIRTFAGPPGLGETPSKEVVPILKLEKSLNVCSRRTVVRTRALTVTAPRTYWENIPALEIEFWNEPLPPTTGAYCRAWLRYKPYLRYSELELTGRLINSGSAPLAWGIEVSRICGVEKDSAVNCRSSLPSPPVTTPSAATD